MLIIEGKAVSQEVEGDIVQMVLEDRDLHAKSVAYLHSPSRLQRQAGKTVLVLQNEVAHCAGEDVVVASYGATTCCIVAIADSLMKNVTLAHVDEGMLRRNGDMEELLAQVGKWEMGPNNRWVWVQQMSCAELYIVGAYCSLIGYKIAHDVLSFFEQHPAQLHLELACIGSANTLPCGAPACQDLAFDTLSWTCFPGTFGEHGPMLGARFARIWSGEYMEIGTSLMAIYDPAEQALVIPPLIYPKPLPSPLIRMVSNFLRLSDEELLQETSTSPDHEAPAFARETRAALQWILEQSECPTKQSEPAVYHWHEGLEWRHEVPLSSPERLLVNASANASLTF